MIGAICHAGKYFFIDHQFNLDMPELRLTHRHIEVFRAIMATGQITRAAQMLHSSQPTLSRELARLEQLLGFALFDRVQGRLRPTVRALALLTEVQQSFVGLERIARTAGALRDFAPAQLHIACLPALAHALVPGAIARFLQVYPHAGVAIHPLESPQLEAALSEQRFDVGLVEGQSAPMATELRPLLSAREVVVLPPGHALAKRAVLHLADFEQQPFVSLAPDDPYRRQIDALFAQAGVQRQLRVESPSAVSVCALVSQGAGVAIVNPLTALALAAPDKLLIRPLALPIAFHVALVLPTWRAVHPLREPVLTALFETAHSLQQRWSALDPPTAAPP